MLGSNCLSKEFANTKNKFTSNNLPQAWQWLCFLLLFCSAHTLESLFKHGDGPPTFVDQVSSFSTPQQNYCILALCQPHAVQFLATRSGKYKKTVRQSISNCSHQVLQVEYKTPFVPHAVPVHRNIIHHIKFLLIEASCKQPQCLVTVLLRAAVRRIPSGDPIWLLCQRAVALINQAKEKGKEGSGEERYLRPSTGC